jgi:hypothetical protein
VVPVRERGWGGGGHALGELGMYGKWFLHSLILMGIVSSHRDVLQEKFSLLVTFLSSFSAFFYYIIYYSSVVRASLACCSSFGCVLLVALLLP